MRKIMTAALAAMTLGGAALATTTVADAAPYGWHGGGYYGHGYGRGYGGGVALGAGLLGLAVGASLAHPHYAYGPGPGYYAGPAYYGYGYGGCRVHYRWDPYAGRYFPVERCY